MSNRLFANWRGNFPTSLAVDLPAAISLGVVIWIFGLAANLTNKLLVFLPRYLTHQGGPGFGVMLWYWSVVAFVIAIFLICAIGLLARNYFGKRIIAWIEIGLLRVPFVNKIYAATKQINNALASDTNNAFKTVVLIEFLHIGIHSIGFITSERHAEVQARTKEKWFASLRPPRPIPPPAGWCSYPNMALPNSRCLWLTQST